LYYLLELFNGDRLCGCAHDGGALSEDIRTLLEAGDGEVVEEECCLNWG